MNRRTKNYVRSKNVYTVYLRGVFMKLGKAYRIFMLVFCGGTLAVLLCLLVCRVLAIFSDTADTVLLFLTGILAGSDEARARYVFCCVPILPAAVAVVYFLCIGKLREAKENGELFPIVLPAVLGLTGIVFPGSFLLLIILMPILYLWTVCIQIARFAE